MTIRRKKFTVGLWLDLTTISGSSTGLQIWNTRPGAVENPKLKWHTVVLAKNEDEALELGQAEYASKYIEKKVQAA